MYRRSLQHTRSAFQHKLAECLLAASRVSCALQACFEEGLRSEAEYSAQREALHLGAEPRRGKI